MHALFAHTHARQSKAFHTLLSDGRCRIPCLSVFFFFFLYLSAFLIVSCRFPPVQFKAPGLRKQWCHLGRSAFYFSTNNSSSAVKSYKCRSGGCFVMTGCVNRFHRGSLLILTVKIRIYKSSEVMLESRGTGTNFLVSLMTGLSTSSSV